LLFSAPAAPGDAPAPEPTRVAAAETAAPPVAAPALPAEIAAEPAPAAPDSPEASLAELIRNFQALSSEEAELRSELVQQAETLVRIVGSDEELKTIITDSHVAKTNLAEFKVEILHDERRDALKTEEAEAGLEWGTDPTKTAAGQVNLTMRLLAQGMRM
jgi:hypothetical protein